MKKYYAIVHQEGESAYGVWFPDLPGCFSAGDTEDEAIVNAKKSLRLYAEGAEENEQNLPAPRSAKELNADPDVRASLAEGNGFFVCVPLIMNSGRTRRVSLDLDVGLIAAIDAVRKESNLTRKAWFEQLARESVLASISGVREDDDCAHT